MTSKRHGAHDLADLAGQHPGYSFGYRLVGTLSDEREGRTIVMAITCLLCGAALIEDPEEVCGNMRLHSRWHRANGHVAAPPIDDESPPDKSS